MNWTWQKLLEKMNIFFPVGLRKNYKKSFDMIEIVLLNFVMNLYQFNVVRLFNQANHLQIRI